MLPETVQVDVFKGVQDVYFERMQNWNEVVPTLDEKCVIVMPWCDEEEACEDDIKGRNGKSYIYLYYGCELVIDVYYRVRRSELAPSNELRVEFRLLYAHYSPCPSATNKKKRW